MVLHTLVPTASSIEIALQSIDKVLSIFSIKTLSYNSELGRPFLPVEV